MPLDILLKEFMITPPVQEEILATPTACRTPIRITSRRQQVEPSIKPVNTYFVVQIVALFLCNSCFQFSVQLLHYLLHNYKVFLLKPHAPGIPKVLVGNRLHLAFKRQVAAKQAELYASRNNMSCFEISPLCDFNIRESFCELARMALHRNGMERIWRNNKVLSLQELCCRTIVRRTSVYAIDSLPLPPSVKSTLKSYALTTSQCFNTLSNNSKSKNRCKTPTSSGRNSCCIT
ncbi:Ras-related protein Rab-40C [Lucilia cuprina]|nr:Ras-related protein Rab-40C [Lucilia cuprina]